MLKQVVKLAVTKKDGVIMDIGKSYISQPDTKPVKGGIKWHDDAKLLKSGKQGMDSPKNNSFRKDGGKDDHKPANRLQFG